MNSTGLLSPRKKFWITLSCLFLTVVVGLVVRLEDLTDWKKQPEIAFFKGEPLLTTLDGYYYLRLARDLVENKYTVIDEERTYPNSPARPSPPPFLSTMVYSLNKITDISINWIAVILPAFLGITIVAPIFGIGRYYGGTSMALSASLIVVLSIVYLQRSSLGWFDTDSLNVTFTMTTIYFCIKFTTLQNPVRYLHLVGFVFCYLLFLWWWDSTPQTVTVISFIPFLIGLIFFYRPSQKEIILFYCILSGILIAVWVWKGINILTNIMEHLWKMFDYISKNQHISFPNVGQLVSEQITPSTKEIIVSTTSDYTVFILAVLGLILLVFKQFKKSLFLLSVALLSTLSLVFSQRFLIFFTPLLSLGFGYLISTAWQTGKKQKSIALLAPLLVLVAAGHNFYLDMSKDFWPKTVSAMVQGMNLVNKMTPKNALIFASWDVGYPVQYWSRRPTVADGASHMGERSVYNAIPLATDDDRLAANFINFFVNNGIEGFATVYQAVRNDKARGLHLIKKILKAGPVDSYKIIAQEQLQPTSNLASIEDWQHFFFPKQTRPIYWFVDYFLTDTTYWWFWLGTWDITLHDGIHPRFRSFLNVKTNNKYISNGQDISGDLTNGTITTSTAVVKVRSATIIDYGNIPLFFQYKLNDKNKDNYLALFKPGQYAALQGSKIHDAVFTRLFIYQEKTPYFTPVKLQTPAYQIYRVNADSWSDENNEERPQETLDNMRLTE